MRLHGVQVNIISDPNNPRQVESVVTSRVTPVATNVTEYYENDLVKAQSLLMAGRTSFEYWPNGQLMAVTDAQQSTFSAYDDDADDRRRVGNALNHPIQFVYDGASRRTTTIFADGSSVSNVFDDVGQFGGDGGGQARQNHQI